MKLAIIGAGLAGIEAALAAHKAGAQAITLYSREACLPYMRPRLPEIAFGSGDVSQIAIHPAEWYAEHGIVLKRDTPVTGVDVGDMLTIKTPDGDEFADSLVIADGSIALKPVIPGLIASSSVYTLATSDDARRISSHIKRARSVAILGGGIIGIETAMRARKAGLKVHLIEKSDRLIPLQFDSAASDVIRETLAGLGVKMYLGKELLSSSEVGSKLCLKLSGETKTLDVDIVILTVGTRSNTALAQSMGLTCDRGVRVDETLQTSCPQIYAAGDCVQYGGQTRNSAMSAVIQGRIAGYNAVVATTTGVFKHCPSDEVPLLFKSGDLELHSWGQTAESCVSAKIKRIDDGKKPGVIRLKVVRSDGMVVGVQMVGTDQGFDDLVKKSCQHT